MMRFERVPEPPQFREKAQKPGLKWLEEHPTADRPRDYWTPFRPALADGFRQLCGYSVMHVPDGTVDHYISCRGDKDLAYEWSNYRYASAWINSSKQNADEKVLDPFEVDDDWFEIHLPSLQLVTTDQIPEDQQQRATYTLERLHLRDDERVIRQRGEWYRMYCDKELNLAGLRKKAPLIARAIERKQEAPS